MLKHNITLYNPTTQGLIIFVALSVLFVAIHIVPLYAQNPDVKPTSGQQKNKSAFIPPSDYFSVGLSYGLGDATFDRAALMISTAYAHRFSSVLGMEAALHYLGRTSMMNGFANMPFSSSIQNTFTGDLSMMIRPFGEAEDLAAQATATPSGKFSIGIGPSVRLRELSIYNSPSQFNNNQGLTIVYPNTVSFGGHLKAEYAFPISDGSEIGLRGQFHLFAPPFVRAGQAPERITTMIPLFQNGGGSVSLGGFLRFGLTQMSLEERRIVQGEIDEEALRREAVPFEKSAQNLVFAEAGGSGIFASVNYERMLSDVVSIRAGLGYFATEGSTSQVRYRASNTMLSVPVVGAYHFLLSQNDHIELGGGITTTFSMLPSDVLQTFMPENLRGPIFIIPTGLLGYRYQPREGGVTVRLSVTPVLFEGRVLMPWAGVSIGYAF